MKTPGQVIAAHATTRDLAEGSNLAEEIDLAIEAALDAENEACAVLVDGALQQRLPSIHHISAAIRARRKESST